MKGTATASVLLLVVVLLLGGTGTASCGRPGFLMGKVQGVEKELGKGLHLGPIEEQKNSIMEEIVVSKKPGSLEVAKDFASFAIHSTHRQLVATVNDYDLPVANTDPHSTNPFIGEIEVPMPS